MNFQICGRRTALTFSDYKIWGKIQQPVYQTKVQDVNDLRQRLIDVLHRLEQSFVDDNQQRSTSPCLH